MIRKIIAIPLASSVHEKKRWSIFLQKYRDILSRFDNIIFHNVLTNISPIPPLDNPRILLLIHLTGGTSRIAKNIFNKYRNAIFILIAHGFQNSLPSALSARQYIRRNGGIVKLIYNTYPSGDKIGKTIEMASKILDFYMSEIIVFTDNDVFEKPKLLEKISMKIVKWSEVMRTLNEVSDNDVKDILAMLSNKIVNIDSLDTEYLFKIIRLYCAMRKYVSDKSFVAVDCFNFIVKYGFTPCLPVAMLNSENIPAACEADINSLLLISILSTLGYKSWMANLTAIEDGYIVFSHCTASLDILRKIELINHFESSKPYAVKGVFNLSNVCIGRMDDEKLDVYLGKIVTVNDSQERCRIQIGISISNPSEILENITGNHHIIFSSNALDSLKSFLDLLGIKINVFD